MSPEELAEQLACLEALDLLEPSEGVTLATLTHQQIGLSAFQRDMREVVGQLAWLAPAGDPPDRLRARILAAPLHRRRTAL
jgi:hypothetical protein